MTRLVIVGAGGHGAVVADAALCAGSWSEVVFHDDRYPALRETLGLPVLDRIDALRARLADRWPADWQLVVAIGDNAARLGLSRDLADRGAALATVVHPAAVVARDCVIAAGTVLLARAVVNPRSRIGGACIVNTGAVVDHDAAIGDGVHLGPGSTLAGHVTVGRLALVGAGAAVIPGVTIGEGAVVGAGATVLRDVDPRATVVGTPARRI